MAEYTTADIASDSNRAAAKLGGGIAGAFIGQQGGTLIAGAGEQISSIVDKSTGRAERDADAAFEREQLKARRDADAAFEREKLKIQRDAELARLRAASTPEGDLARREAERVATRGERVDRLDGRAAPAAVGPGGTKGPSDEYRRGFSEARAQLLAQIKADLGADWTAWFAKKFPSGG